MERPKKMQQVPGLTSIIRVAPFLALCSVLLSGSAYAESVLGSSLESLRHEIQVLREGQRELKTDLEEIKRLLNGREELARKELPRLKLPLDGSPTKGAASAKIVVVEFSDYECPYCARHFRETLPSIERDYISTGKIQYNFRNFPIETLHRNAAFDAEAGLCAGDQGKYWEMHDLLFATQEELHRYSVFEHAKTVGLHLGEFQLCLAEKAKYETVRKDLRSVTAAGVSGTPMFFIGRLDWMENEGTEYLDVQQTINGAKPYETFRSAIDNLLSR